MKRKLQSKVKSYRVRYRSYHFLDIIAEIPEAAAWRWVCYILENSQDFIEYLPQFCFRQLTSSLIKYQLMEESIKYHPDTGLCDIQTNYPYQLLCTVTVSEKNFYGSD